MPNLKPTEREIAANSKGSGSNVGKMKVKFYLVLKPKGEGVEIIDSKQTRGAADAIAATIEGAYTQKHIATK